MAFFEGFPQTDPDPDPSLNSGQPSAVPAPPQSAPPSAPPPPTSGLVKYAARRTAGDLQYAPPAAGTPATSPAPIFDPVAAFAAASAQQPRSPASSTAPTTAVPTVAPTPISQPSAASSTADDDINSIKALLGNEPDDTATASLSPTAPMTMAPAMTGAPDDDDARGQYQRDETATNKYLRGQGVQMTVTPTGQTQPATDQWGNPAYKPAIIDPARQLPDGDFYRVTRNAEGNEQHFRLRDGAQGQDFHLDPASGEMYVTTNGENGASKRTVIGVDHFVPASSDMRGMVQGHQADERAAGLAEDDATHGVQGAPGLGAVPLATLREQHRSISEQRDDAAKHLSDADAYIRAGNTLNAAQLDQFRSASAAYDRHAPTLNDITNEIGAREQSITAAQQQRANALRGMRDAAGFQNVLRTDQGRTQVKAALGQVLAGGDLDEQQASRYASAGLVKDDGSGRYALTDRGLGILSGGKPPAPPTPTTTPPPSSEDDDPAQPLPVRVARVRQNTLDQQRSILSEFPGVGVQGSPANQRFLRAFQAAGSDPRKALMVARTLFAGAGG